MTQAAPAPDIAEETAPLPYRLFEAVLARRRALSPALCRITFAGPDIAAMKTAAPDQRIKIFFPDAAGRPSALPNRADWYSVYRAVPPADRAPMRTYTVRALRADDQELDVDFVLHGATGPASRWAMEAVEGARVQIAAPNRAFAGDPHGYEWKPPATVGHVLLIADETAVPAAAGILEELAGRPAPPPTQAFFEVPSAADRLSLPSWPGLELTWLPRDREVPVPHEGALMAAAVKAARLPAPAAAADDALRAIDIDREILWELAAPAEGGFYAWVAGEAEAVMAIRKTLIKERGLDKRSMNLMGYWRRGRALDDA